MKAAADLDAYLKAVPPQAKKTFSELRALVKKAAPKATEVMSYGIPTLVLHGNLVHVGAYEGHVALYGGKAMARLGPLSKFQTGKGTLRFELGAKLPKKDLVAMVKARVAENTARAAAKVKRPAPKKKATRVSAR
jgi:uncharacterized protein YdhG (YjbR/CyaY superfamily)